MCALAHNEGDRRTKGRLDNRAGNHFVNRNVFH